MIGFKSKATKRLTHGMGVSRVGVATPKAGSDATQDGVGVATRGIAGVATCRVPLCSGKAVASSVCFFSSVR